MTANIAFIILSIIGAVLLIKFVRDIVMGQKSSSWPNVSGTVIQSIMETKQDTDAEGFSSTTYGAKIHYKYLVGGKEYESWRRTFSEVSTSSMRRTQEILARYPQGASVAVYYDPEDPSSAVLESGVGTSSYIFLGFAILLLLAGLAGLLGLFG
jgi:hypothetical protein